jgi:CheY-like chemotaxis protein
LIEAAGPDFAVDVPEEPIVLEADAARLKPDIVLLVALTGWGQDEHKRRTQEAGFDRHLTKPADRAALEAVLSERRGVRPAV